MISWTSQCIQVLYLIAKVAGQAQADKASERLASLVC
jgi:hypothetical protein